MKRPAMPDAWSERAVELVRYREIRIHRSATCAKGQAMDPHALGGLGIRGGKNVPRIK